MLPTEGDLTTGAEPGSMVTALLDHESGIIELTVHGRWSHRLCTTLYRTVQKCLAEHPTALVLDLSGLHDPHAASAPFWLTVAAQGRRLQPTVPVVACLPRTNRLSGRLDRLGVTRDLPIFATLRLAHTAVTSHRPTTSRVRLQLPPVPTSVRNARQIVTAACTEWGMPGLLPRALLVVSELVANAVVHVGSPIDVVISHRGTLRRAATRGSTSLHLAVHDEDHRMPPSRGTGLGLRLVTVASYSWGVLPTRQGKVVWAILREPTNPSEVPV
ncbi:ATP-binding protein [Actinoplanes sp. NPDC024001]|uniref:ATP-binding protein n=1 Tax=Actinoplanes sp. NPDC024001 TaxID=3154598 RepID=UPI0033F8F44B